MDTTSLATSRSQLSKTNSSMMDDDLEDHLDEIDCSLCKETLDLGD